MAKTTKDTAQEFKRIKSAIETGDIAPFYLLHGKEHYYLDALCDLLMERVIPPQERDFGQIVFYGADTTAMRVVEAARQFPMMISRQLVVLKEAQMMDKIEGLSLYLDAMMPSTVLVVCYKTVNDPTKSAKGIDKRTSFYKKACQSGVVFESEQAPDYRMPSVIEAFMADRGLEIAPDAAGLLAEFSGVNLQKIAVEVDKLMKVLPPGTRTVTAGDIEANIGMSREYSVFELTKALSLKDSLKCFRIAHFYAQSPKRYPLVVTLAALSSHFIKLLNIAAMEQSGMSQSQALASLGINAFFSKEYSTALRNYPLSKLMNIIPILKEYDMVSKGSGRGSAQDGDLLTEILSKILA